MRRISSCPCIVQQNHSTLAFNTKHMRKSVSTNVLPEFFNSFIELVQEEVQAESVFHVPVHVAHVCLLESATDFPTSILQIQKKGSYDQFENLIKCLKEPYEVGDTSNGPNIDMKRESLQFLYDKSAFRSIRIRRRRSLWL